MPRSAQTNQELTLLTTQPQQLRRVGISFHTKRLVVKQIEATTPGETNLGNDDAAIIAAATAILLLP